MDGSDGAAAEPLPGRAVKAPRSGSPALLQLALGVVFGIPFLYCAQGALRGRLFVGRLAYFGNDALISGYAAWVVTTALAALWLGLSLQLGSASRVPERIRNALGAVLTFAGVTVLLFSARLLSLR
jgi:hypothetical protein